MKETTDLVTEYGSSGKLSDLRHGHPEDFDGGAVEGVGVDVLGNCSGHWVTR